MPTLASVYCTTADLAARISQFGLDLRLDDDGDGLAETANTTAVIEAACVVVNMILLGVRYTAAELAQSVEIVHASSALALLYACRRRANDGSAGLHAEVAMWFGDPVGTGGLLGQVRDGTMKLDVTGSSDRSPALSNYSYRGWLAHPFPAVDSQSTGGTSAITGRNLDPFDRG